MSIKTKKTSNKDVAAKVKSASTDSFSNKSKLDKATEHMRKNGYAPTQPIDFDADGQVNKCKVVGPSGSFDCLYIYDRNKPVVFLYSPLDSDKVYKMVFATEDEGQKAEREQKVEQYEATLSAALLGNVKTSVDHDPSGQMEVSQSTKISSEIDSETIDRLVAMTPFEYDRVRKVGALGLGIRASTLDKAVEETRKLSLSIKTLGPRLLSDVYNVFVIKSVVNIGTNDLITALCDDKHSIWSGFNRGEHICDSQIAFILKHCDVTSKDIRFGDKVFKGYAKDDISAVLFRNPAISDTEFQPDENPDVEK